MAVAERLLCLVREVLEFVAVDRDGVERVDGTGLAGIERRDGGEVWSEGGEVDGASRDGRDS